MRARWENAHTIASGIRVPQAIGDFLDPARGARERRLCHRGVGRSDCSGARRSRARGGFFDVPGGRGDLRRLQAKPRRRPRQRAASRPCCSIARPVSNIRCRRSTARSTGTSRSISPLCKQSIRGRVTLTPPCRDAPTMQFIRSRATNNQCVSTISGGADSSFADRLLSGTRLVCFELAAKYFRRDVSRFCAARDGATAVEFALIAPAFLAMLFAIIQTTLFLFAQATLQNAAVAGRPPVHDRVRRRTPAPAG